MPLRAVRARGDAVTPADAVLADALREAGHEHVTPWHVTVGALPHGVEVE